MAVTQRLAMYSQTQAMPTEQLVHEYAPLVKRIAHHLMARLPDSVQLDDLIQAGMIGLLEAARKYDAAKGASFETYAGIRIRGAMVDEMRKGDWVPRSVHRNARRISEAISQVEARLGRDAEDHEVAEALDMSLEDYHNALQDAAGGRLFSFEEMLEQGGGELDTQGQGGANPMDGLQRKAFHKSLTDAIGTLPERERLVLALYYNEELNLKEIGQVLSVSESRVSQLHSQAAMRLRARLSEWR